MRFAIVAVCLGALGAAAGPLQAQEAHDHMGLPGGLQTQFHGFVDVTARTTSLNGDHSAFGLGQYDFFLTSRLAEHISFVGESVFEFDDDFVVDVERIIITFSPNRFFRVAVGKHHTPFGYWNNAYHHGTLFQPTIERALPVRFEDDGGPFPVHTTGLLVSGRDISRFHLGYDVLVGNGIGSTPIQDNNTAKSYTLAVHSQVTSGLQVGASLYLDRIASGTPSLGGAPLVEQVDQRMYGGFAAYLSETWEAIGEFYRSDNTIAGGRKTGSNAFFVYAGRRFGRLVPYLRYDEMDFAVGDPYYTIDDQRLGLVGVRYDLASTTGIKLELQRQKLASVGTFSQLMAQVAVGF